MVESDEKQLIRTTGAAACYMSGTRKEVLAAAAQVLCDIKYQDKNLEKILEVIKTLSHKGAGEGTLCSSFKVVWGEVITSLGNANKS